MAGVTDRGYLFEISDAIARQDSVAALEKIAELRQQSVDMRRLCMELAGHYRNLMLCALPGGTELLTGTSPEEEAAYAQRKDFPQGDAIRAINAFGTGAGKNEPWHRPAHRAGTGGIFSDANPRRRFPHRRRRYSRQLRLHRSPLPQQRRRLSFRHRRYNRRRTPVRRRPR